MRKERKERMKELRFGALRGMNSLWQQTEPAPQEEQQESTVYSQEDVERLLAQKEAEWQRRQEAAVQAARSEAESLRHELNNTLGLGLKSLRIVAVYDLFGFSPELLESTRYSVFGERATDTVTDTMGCT